MLSLFFCWDGRKNRVPRTKSAGPFLTNAHIKRMPKKMRDKKDMSLLNGKYPSLRFCIHLTPANISPPRIPRVSTKVSAQENRQSAWEEPAKCLVERTFPGLGMCWDLDYSAKSYGLVMCSAFWKSVLNQSWFLCSFRAATVFHLDPQKWIAEWLLLLFLSLSLSVCGVVLAMHGRSTWTGNEMDEVHFYLFLSNMCTDYGAPHGYESWYI